MSGQPSLFDLAEGLRRRDEGRSRAVSRHADWLEQARRTAVRLCHEQGTVSADDLRAAGIEVPPDASANIFGSIFNDSRFVQRGYTLSKRPEAHANLLRLWGLR